MEGTIWFTFRGRKWTTPRRWGEGPPDDGGGDDGEAREEEGDERDEETISVTDSSTPGEPGRGDGAGGPPEGGGPPEDPDNFPEGGKDLLGEGPADIEVKGEGQGYLVEMAYQALWDQ